MLRNFTSLFTFCLCFIVIRSVKDVQVESDTRVAFINLKNFQPTPLPMAEFLDRLETRNVSLYIQQRSNGCSCQELICGCCMVMSIEQFSWEHEGCMNMTYVPREFAITMDVLWDQKPMYTNTVSGKNPPPFCTSVPFFTNVKMCTKLYDIYTPGQNIHVCMDMEVRLNKTPMMLLHFDCMTMGQDGFQILKPGEELTPMGSGEAEESAHYSNPDIYDPVTEIKL